MGDVWIRAVGPGSRQLVRVDHVATLGFGEHGLTAGLRSSVGDNRVLLLDDSEADRDLPVALIAAIDQAGREDEATIITLVAQGNPHEYVCRIELARRALTRDRERTLIVDVRYPAD